MHSFVVFANDDLNHCLLQYDISCQRTKSKYYVEEDQKVDIKVLQDHLPEVKNLLIMDELYIYLLAEHVVEHDDKVKLTVTGQLSKNEVIINLYDIIKSKKTVTKFLRALERSAADHPGHKELFEIITASKQQALSQPSESDVHTQNNVSQSTATNNDNDVHIIELEDSGPVVDEEIPDQPVCRRDSTESDLCPMGHQAELQQVNDNLLSTRSEVGCGLGYTFGVFTVVGLILLALGITIISYGVAGYQGQDVCADSETLFQSDLDLAILGVFDIILGITTIFLAVIILFGTLAIYYELKSVCLILRRVLLCHVAFLMIPFVLCLVIIFVYSFIIASDLYHNYPLWKSSAINCTSPVLYIAYVYINLQYTLIGLFILLFIIMFIVSILTCTLCPNFYK